MQPNDRPKAGVMSTLAAEIAADPRAAADRLMLYARALETARALVLLNQKKPAHCVKQLMVLLQAFDLANTFPGMLNPLYGGADGRDLVVCHRPPTDDPGAAPPCST